MKNILTIILMSVCCLTGRAGVHTYASESVLSQGRFVKVRIADSGLYRLTYDDLRAKGLNPAEVRVFGYGGAMLPEDFTLPMPDDLPEIAVYDTGSAILFYARGVDRIDYDRTRAMFTHRRNPYSLYGYYFVTSDEVGRKKRIALQPVLTPETGNTVTEFTDVRVHEEDLTSLVQGGRELYGERFAVGDRLELPVGLSRIVPGSELRVRLNVTNTSTLAVSPDGRDTLTNNKSTYTLSLDGRPRHSFEVNGCYGYDNAAPADALCVLTADGGEKTELSLSFSNDREPTATGYLNYAEINVQRPLAMTGAAMTFRNRLHLGEGAYNRYRLTAPHGDVLVWRVTDPLQVEQVPAVYAGGAHEFVDRADEAEAYVAVDLRACESVPSATLLDEVPRQNLHGMAAADMLIITHVDFRSEALRLAEAHRDYNGGLRVAVLTADEVYNEFSSGTPDATAYRRVCKMLYDRHRDTPNRLKYLLLVGKGSYDNRGLLPVAGDRYLLTYQAEQSLNRTAAYASDDYFGLLDDHEGMSIGGKDRLDIGIGRFPVRTPDEARRVVDKTIRYMKGEEAGAGSNHLCFIGDAGDNNSHMRQANSFANNAQRNHKGYHVHKLLLDAYRQDEASGDYPEAKRRFRDLMDSGLLLVNYMGHGTVNGWSRILSMSDIRSFDNSRLPIFVSGTCEFSRFDREYVTAAEELLKHEGGGAIGVFSATRTVYQYYNEAIVRNFTDSLLAIAAESRGAVGDAIRAAKNNSYQDDGNLDKMAPNTLSYVYFGDPALRLDAPTDCRVSLHLQTPDTLRALSVATVQGRVTDRQGRLMDSFNGLVDITLLDKETTRKTLGNGGSTPYGYTDRTVLSRGKARVKEGEFEYSFMVPRDLRYNYGKGRFCFYAIDSLNRCEGQGYCEDFVVGGYSEDFVAETDGPEITAYLDDERFVPGGKVGETPLFVAEVYDASGVTTYSATPGHDLMLCVDNEAWYPMADHYTSSGDYRSGTVRYVLPRQTVGKHVLMFRAWDFPGNSTTKTVEYEVVDGSRTTGDLAVSCYPNPVQSTAHIRIDYPVGSGEGAQVVLELFDRLGRRVGMTTRQDSPADVAWSVSDLPSGVYVLRVSVTSPSGEVEVKANKIMVARQ